MFGTTLFFGMASVGIWSVLSHAFALQLNPRDVADVDSVPPAVVVSSFDDAKVVQSEIVEFTRTGRVRVEAIEQVGQFPTITFTSAEDGSLLLRSSIEDKEGWLKPVKDSGLTQPQIRFTSIESPTGPVIMSVAMFAGGSDNAFYLTLFAEDKGIVRLNSTPLFTSIQGGFYLGQLNSKFGFGLVTWNFIWGDGLDESHYSSHKYLIELYKVHNGRLVRKLKVNTRRMYESPNRSLSEIGVSSVYDQRSLIPVIKEFADYTP